jgi:predicted phage tail protein
MQLVMLAGELGEKYGKQHEYYNLQTPADAIKLLCINYPALQEDMMQAHHNGIGYKVIQGGAAMGYGELNLPFGSKPLLVVPVITGAGGSTGQILAGVGLVAASFLFPGAGLFGAGSGIAALSGVSTAVGTGISAIGAGLILSGTANLISPQLDLNANRVGKGTRVRGPGPEGITRGALGEQSYAFTGPANTVGTGETLPVIYGRVITGSHLLAANIDITDESDKLKQATQPPSLDTLKVNGEELTTELNRAGGLISRRGIKRVNSADNDRDERMPFNKTFGPNGSKPLATGEIYNNKNSSKLKYLEERKFRKEIDVLFEINTGLFARVGGEGTTKVDGFITYLIKLEIEQGKPNVTVATAQVTIQGLINPSQNVRYGHRLKMPGVPNRNENDLMLTVEIIDAEVDENVSFKVQSYGYNLLADERLEP